MRALLLALLLGACGAPAPIVKLQPVEVRVPVPVACVDRKDIPVEPARVGALPDDARVAADLLGDKVLELRHAFRLAAGLLEGCAD